MITKLQIQNYKALRDVTLEFTPFHLLIGPNDSGKTSILEAIAALCRSVEHPVKDAFLGGGEKGPEVIWQCQSDLRILFDAILSAGEHPYHYQLSISSPPAGKNLQTANETIKQEGKLLMQRASVNRTSAVYRAVKHSQEFPCEDELLDAVTAIYRTLRGVQYYHWDSRFLALPAAPDSKRRFQMERSGFGLVLCLDDLLGYDRDRFIQMEQRFKEIFPEVKSIKLISEPAYKSPQQNVDTVPMLQRSDGKGLYFEYHTGGPPISAMQISDGVLLVLAYLAILYLPEPPRVLLIEEPENGIHPNRLKEVLSILRDLVSEQSHTQVVMTTHSPYVVDLFKPEEVTLCQKQKDGSVAVRRLSDSQTVKEQIDVFTLGEIWTAEGDDKLLNPIKAQGEPQE